MQDIVLALGIILLFEGVLYALFPQAMRKMMIAAISLPEAKLRSFGLAAFLTGFVILYLLKT